MPEYEQSSVLNRWYKLITDLSRITEYLAATPDPDKGLGVLGIELKQLGLSYFIALNEINDRTFPHHYTSIPPETLSQIASVANLGEINLPWEPDQFPLDTTNPSVAPVFIDDVFKFGLEKFFFRLGDNKAKQVLRLLDITSTTSGIYHPLIFNNQVLGILGIWSDNLQEKDLSLVSVFANQATVILKNAQLLTQLRESEMRYRILSELASDYAYAIRIEADGTSIWEWVTEAFTKITGFTPAEIYMGKGWTSLIHPDDILIALKHMETLVSGQASVSEFRIVSKQGAVYCTTYRVLVTCLFSSSASATTMGGESNNI
ncbi:MAG: PAS domain-containing protein [Chloroflexota bacterium]